MEEYVIHVTKTGYRGLDGKWGVGFSVDKTDTSGKEVTFCILRGQGAWFTPHAGCAVHNPKDENDPMRGKRTAFKRAIESLPLSWMDEEEKQTVVDRFRGALWIAMGRPGYTKVSKSEEKIISGAIKAIRNELLDVPF
jgi:hypothetical protein